MQGLHPGIKVVTSLLLIFVAASMHSWLLLLLLNLYLLFLAYLSAVPLGTFLKRVWVFIPIFTAIIVLPTLFNVVRTGDPLVVLFHYGDHHQLTITRQGVQGVVLFVLRVAACVSIAVLLTLTTRWAYLMRGFSMFRVPTIFIKILEMTYRYIYVLLNSASDMFALLAEPHRWSHECQGAAAVRGQHHGLSMDRSRSPSATRSMRRCCPGGIPARRTP